MVKFGRVELLSHPLCKAYLAMKWWVLVIIESLCTLYQQVIYGKKQYTQDIKQITY